MNIGYGYIGRRGWLDDDDVGETVGVCAASQKNRTVHGALDRGRRDRVGIAIGAHGADEHNGGVMGRVGKNALRKVVDALLEIRQRRAADGEQESQERDQFQHHLNPQKVREVSAPASRGFAPVMHAFDSQ